MEGIGAGGAASAPEPSMVHLEPWACAWSWSSSRHVWLLYEAYPYPSTQQFTGLDLPFLVSGVGSITSNSYTSSGTCNHGFCGLLRVIADSLNIVN